MRVPIRISLKDGLEMISIWGAPGCGKTRLLAAIYACLLDEPVTTLWYGCEGDEEGLIVALERRMNTRRTVLLECGQMNRQAVGSRFGFDPFYLVPGADLGTLIDDATNSLGALARVETPSYGFVKPIMAELLEEKRNGRRVVIDDLYREVQKAKPSPMREALMTRLEVVKDTPLFRPDLAESFDLDSMLRAGAHYLFMLSDCPHLARKYFVSALTAMIMRKRRVMNDAVKPEARRTYVYTILDECHLFVPSTGQHDLQLPLLDLLHRGRRLGCAGIFVTQRPAEIHASFSQAGTLICGRQATSEDLSAVTHAMALTAEQVRMVAMLPHRTFVCRKRGTFPFILQSADLSMAPVERVNVDAWNAEVGEDWRRASGEPGSEEEGRETTEQPADPPADTPAVPAEPEAPKAKVPEETEEAPELVFARAVNEHRFATTQEVYDSLRGKLGQYEANKIRTRLVKSGDLVAHKVKTGARGGGVSSMELTEQGLLRFGLTAPAACGRGGYEHQFLASRIGRYFAGQGKQVSWERKLGKGTFGERLADVWIEPDAWAVQVAVHNQSTKEVAAIVDLAGVEGVQRVLVVCNDKGHKEALEDDLVGCLTPGKSAEVTICLACEVMGDE